VEHGDVTTQPTRPAQFQINRLPADDDELWWAIFGLWGIRIPRQAVCKGHVAPFTALADAYFARYPWSVWKASRGLGGKSRTLAALSLTEATLLGIEVTLLGGSSAQSLNVHEATKDAWAWHASPRGLLERPPTRWGTELKNEGHLRTLTASTTSVRGPHPPRLRCDEIDEMDQWILDSAMGQPMEQMNYLGYRVPTQTVLSSTHQYPDKTMAEMLKRAMKQGMPIYEWCYKESSNPVDGWLTPEAIERARSTVSEHMWQTEYDLQEPSFDGRAIDSASVERCFDASMGEFDGDKMVYMDYVPTRHYLTAVDWAKHRDQTIIATFDTTEHPWTCVAWQKVNKLPWPNLVAKAVGQWRQYGDRFVHDRTGVGEFAHDEIRAQVTSTEFAKVIGVVMGGGRERDALYNDYIAAIEHDDVRYPRINWAYKEHLYVTPDALFTSKEHAPDSVVVGALAWSQRKRHTPIVGVSGGTRGSSPWQV
jgi:hypothetical protein